MPFPAGADALFAVNVAATQGLLEHARRSGSRAFVLASSGSVYGSTEAGTLSEESPLAAQDFYAATKVAAERFAPGVRTAAGRHHPPALRSLRARSATADAPAPRRADPGRRADRAQPRWASPHEPGLRRRCRPRDPAGARGGGRRRRAQRRRRRGDRRPRGLGADRRIPGTNRCSGRRTGSPTTSSPTRRRSMRFSTASHSCHCERVSSAWCATRAEPCAESRDCSTSRVAPSIPQRSSGWRGPSGIEGRTTPGVRRGQRWPRHRWTCGDRPRRPVTSRWPRRTGAT